MHYEGFQPHPALTPFVSSLYFFRGNAESSGQRHTFRFPSDGGPEMIVNLGTPFAAGSKATRLKTLAGGSLIGPLSSHLVTRTFGLTAFVAVRFRPGGMTPFFGIPPAELTDQSTGIDAFWGAFGRRVEERVQSAPTPAEAIMRVQKALGTRLNHRYSPDRKMLRAVDTILANRGQLRVGHLAGAIGLSRRQFERRFRQATGLSPKRLCRISRFANLCSRMNGSGRQDWAGTALACGYSDQAHMIRECRFFTGHSPRNYLKKRSPLEAAIHSKTASMSHFFNTAAAKPGRISPRPAV